MKHLKNELSVKGNNSILLKCPFFIVLSAYTANLLIVGQERSSYLKLGHKL